ncbi:MAG: hypothetical protein ACFFEF_19305 [Candidatus Thorarchaeota archaeon]
MEPFGTITNFYPFLSEETRSIVQSVLQDAEGYDDFVERLIDVCRTLDIAIDFAFFTAIQSFFTSSTEHQRKLRHYLESDVVLEPWSLIFSEEYFEDWETRFPSALNKALENLKEDWMRFHILLLGLNSPKIIDRQDFHKQAEDFLMEHPNLKCFSSYIYYMLGREQNVEWDAEKAIEQYNQALRSAELFNDEVKIADYQSAIAGVLKDSNIFEAIDILEKSYQKYAAFGCTCNKHIAASNMGLFHTIIGEYDLALEFYYISFERELSLYAKEILATVLTRVFCETNNPKQAMEWTEWTFDDKVTTNLLIDRLEKEQLYSTIFFSLAVARILIQVGQVEGVSRLLDAIHKTVLKRGFDLEYMAHNTVLGLFDIATGKLVEGFGILEDALAEAERLNSQVYVNSLLLELTKAEVKHFEKLDSKSTTESSGPWMTRFERHAREKNYSGIQMQHALLKAEYQEMIGETDAAQLTLQDALTFTDSPGVKTLRKRIQERLQKLEASVDI